MKKSFAKALQTAYVTALNGNLTYESANVPVVDGIYHGSAKNYVLIGNINEIPDDTLDSYQKEVIVDLHIFTKQYNAASKDIANDIEAQILPILFPGAIGVHGLGTIADFQILNVRQEASNWVEEPGEGLNIMRKILPIRQTIIQQ